MTAYTFFTFVTAGVETSELTLANWKEFLFDSYYHGFLWKTARISAITAFLCAVMGLDQGTQADAAQHDQQQGHGQKGNQQLDMDTGRDAGDETGQPVDQLAPPSCTRLRRSASSSSGSKATPRYCTRRWPRPSMTDASVLCSTSPAALLRNATP